MNKIMKTAFLLMTVSFNVVAGNDQCMSDMLEMRRIVNRYGHSTNVPDDGDSCQRCPGVPGKRGGPGPRGIIGARGPKGNPGECVCDMSDLEDIKARLKELEDFKENVKKTEPRFCYAGIKPTQITASSVHSSSYCLLRNIVLHSNGGWCAKWRNQEQWAQVDLSSPKTITGIVTQGARPASEWVTKFRISYGNDANHLTSYQKNRTPELFIGNNDRNTIKINQFDPPITARFIRVHPVQYYSHISMRIELLVC